MKYEARLKKLEEFAETLPEREDLSQLTDTELNARIVATIDAMIEEHGGPEAYIENSRECTARSDDACSRRMGW